ncbi:MAG TPA: aromatic amino acid ammonia-lyase, partial [Cyclobacteriaceae bacterium]|nr:aromatic amino acid ammonia-lyase [Cyclobacteriaceae bacterium]
MHTISSANLSFSDLQNVLSENARLGLSEESIGKISRCREYLDKKIASSSEPVYGINTGFGSLYNKNIPKDQLEKLQENLVMSHACGMGAEVPHEIVKLILFLKIQSLAYGHSGVQVATVQRLVDLFNSHMLPTIYEMGSLGASGDLAPLAHLSLPLIGLGEVYFENRKYSGGELLKLAGWEKLHLKSKEGLALLNGTQFMSAYGVWCLINAQRILQLANLIGALSLDAFDGRLDPFDRDVHR